MVANVSANAITVRATAPVVGIVERVLAANDKPRAEVVIDVEILEVNRERAKRYGLDLSRYAISTTYSPGGFRPETATTARPPRRTVQPRQRLRRRQRRRLLPCGAVRGDLLPDHGVLL